jgi:hypothetical protein
LLVVDEYLAVRVLAGQWPHELPGDETLGVPTYRHYRLLQRIHQPGAGQLSTALIALDDSDKEVLRRPHPEVLQILDARPLLDDATSIGAAFSSAGLLVCETLAAALAHNRQLWFGNSRNVGTRLAEIAAELNIEIRTA